MGALNIGIPCGLFALNLLIGWRLLNQEYSAHYDSIEPIFYAIADYLKINWLHPGWWKQWNCGMPFRYTYQPLLHHAVALVATLAHWTSARAFHFTLALFYAAGPVTLYLLALRLSGRMRIALTAALLYSLWSPSALLMPDVAADIDGMLHARRLHTAVIYGDGPYVAGLTLVPLALLLLHRASQCASIPNIFFAALATIAVPLTNIPAAMSLAMMLIAYLLSADPAERIPRLRAIAICSALGYMLAAPLLPVSEFALVAQNTQWMDVSGQMSAGKFLLLVAGLAMLAGVAFLLRWLRLQQFARFSILFTLITAVIVLGKDWGGFSLIAQPTRFHLAMEMAIVMALASCAVFVTKYQRTITAIALAAALWQFGEYRFYAHSIVKREPPYNRSEYKISHWLDQHAAGNRVIVPGSVSFWLNAFTTTPQVTGCCDQNYLFQAPRIAVYQMGTDDGAGQQAAAISIVWLKVLGIKYVALSGPKSTETYHVTHHPHKFDNVLPMRWRDGDDAIFEVPGPAPSLAHWITPAEVIPSVPINGIEIEPLKPFAAAVDDQARPRANFSWIDSGTALVHGLRRAGDLLSLQIPFHRGWSAQESDGHLIPVSHDGLGLLLLNPACQGSCEVKLIFTGGIEATVLKSISAAAWAGMAILWMTYTTGFYGSSRLLNFRGRRWSSARDGSATSRVG